MLACTAALATGIMSMRGNLLAQAHDTNHDWETIRVELVFPQDGNRFLKSCGPGPGNLIPTLNEKGVSIVGFFRPAREFPPFPGEPKYISEDELMRRANSAREYISLWSENMTQYGTPGFMGGGSIGRMLVDSNEGYMIEGANCAYGDPTNHAIHGPMTDQVFACANFFVNSKLKMRVESGVGLGYNRAKRLWELLIERQYDCCAMEIKPAGKSDLPFYGSGIALPYFMSIFRDHGDLSPAEGRMSKYIPEERGNKAVCCHGINTHTKCVTICNPVEDHTDLLSCLWLTFGQPCLSPFLPVYIGVNSLPDDITKESNPLARIFEELRLALEFHPEYSEKIKNHWTIFEIQTIEESYKLERDAAALADSEKVTPARVLLTEFVNRKWAAAMSMGKEWLEIIKSIPLA
jgi:hypothetical protein